MRLDSKLVRLDVMHARLRLEKLRKEADKLKSLIGKELPIEANYENISKSLCDITQYFNNPKKFDVQEYALRMLIRTFKEILTGEQAEYDFALECREVILLNTDSEDVEDIKHILKGLKSCLTTK